MAPDWRGAPSRLHLRGRAVLRLLSCFTDEAGAQDMAAGYYLTALVFHDQSKELAQYIGPYLDRLSLEGLADIPFHGVDLIHGHGDYEGISPEKRKRHLIAFSMFVRTLPITYRVFSYERAYTEDRDRLEARLRKDISTSCSTVSTTFSYTIGWRYTTMEPGGGDSVSARGVRLRPCAQCRGLQTAFPPGKEAGPGGGLPVHGRPRRETLRARET